MFRTTILVTFALSLALAARAAAPSFLGPSGLMHVPTTETLGVDQYDFGFMSDAGSNTQVYSFNYGIRPHLEAGITRCSLPEQRTVVNLKYNLAPETRERIGVSVGALDITNAIATNAYLVTSTPIILKNAGSLANMHLYAGLGLGGQARTPVALQGLFAGMSVDVINHITIVAEQDSMHFNYGARVQMTDGLTGQFSFVGQEHNLVVGFGYVNQF